MLQPTTAFNLIARPFLYLLQLQVWLYGISRAINYLTTDGALLRGIKPAIDAVHVKFVLARENPQFVDKFVCIKTNTTSKWIILSTNCLHNRIECVVWRTTYLCSTVCVVCLAFSFPLDVVLLATC
jgi:hypothetical protein